MVLHSEFVDPGRLLAAAPDPAEQLVADLRAEYGDVRVVGERERIAARHYDSVASSPETLYRYAATWPRRDGAALLVRPSDDDGWTPPGGTREPGETLAETAKRETREETGLRVSLTGALEVRIAEMTVAERTDDGHRVREDLPEEYSLGAVFHAAPVGGDLQPEPGEIDAVGWFRDLPDREDLVWERVADYPV